MFEDIMFKCIVMFGAAALALATWGVARLNSFLMKKIKNEYMKGVLIRLDDAALNAVKAVHQAFVSGLKNKDKFSDEDKKAAKGMAMDAMKSYLGPKGIEEAAKVLGMDDAKMGDKIEAAVADMKAGK